MDGCLGYNRLEREEELMSDESKKSMPMENVDKPNPQNIENQRISENDLDKVAGGIRPSIVDPDCPPGTLTR